VLGTQGGFALALFEEWGGGVKYCWRICSSNFSFRNKFIIFLSCGLLADNNTFYKLYYLKVLLVTDDGDYENRNVNILLIIKSKAMKNCTIKLSQISSHFLPNEGNVFCNCIMVIHNFRIVDETEYLLLVMVEKGG